MKLLLYKLQKSSSNYYLKLFYLDKQALKMFILTLHSTTLESLWHVA